MRSSGTEHAASLLRRFSVDQPGWKRHRQRPFLVLDPTGQRLGRLAAHFPGWQPDRRQARCDQARPRHVVDADDGDRVGDGQTGALTLIDDAIGQHVGDAQEGVEVLA